MFSGFYIEVTICEIVNTSTINVIRKDPSHTLPVFLWQTRLITAEIGRINSNENNINPASAVGKDIPICDSQLAEVVPGIY